MNSKNRLFRCGEVSTTKMFIPLSIRVQGSKAN